jgi:hypothetical protein
MSLALVFAIIVVAIALALASEWLLYRLRDRGIGDGPLLARAYRDTRNWLDNVRKRTDQLVIPDYLPEVADFKIWAEANLNARPRLRDWLLSLPETGLKALISQLAQFCQELSINLNWLVRGDLRAEPKLETTIHQIVVEYCEACLKAVQIQQQLKEFSEYEQALATLAQRRNRAKTQRVLEKLQAHELAPPMDSAMLAASEDERYAYVLNLLKQSAQQDRETFDRVLTEVQGASHQPVASRS